MVLGMSDTKDPYLVDDLEQADESVGPSSQEGAAEGPAPTPKRTPRRKATSGKAYARRVVQQVRTLDAASEEDRAFLSVLLGVSGDDVDELAVEAVDAGASAREPLTDLEAIRSADAMDAVIEAIALHEKSARFKSVWDLTATLVPSDTLPGRVPAQPAKAGGALAKAVASLDPADVTNLRDRLDLIR